MVLSVARNNPQFAQNLLSMINQAVNRDTDKKFLKRIIIERQQIISQADKQ